MRKTCRLEDDCECGTRAERDQCIHFPSPPETYRPRVKRPKKAQAAKPPGYSIAKRTPSLSIYDLLKGYCRVIKRKTVAHQRGSEREFGDGKG